MSAKQPLPIDPPLLGAESPLASYATYWRASKGRSAEETPAADRSPFQRDRDRIIHADAFRRLQYKMQVFANMEEGDFRTRLTHSLEVAQLARTMSRSLKLDEDLAETVALSHDLGHPPFGHAGEDALKRCMKGFGGFDHNLQALRIVRQLEQRYGGFDGLNLTWESLEGIAKHNGPLPEYADHPLVKDLDPTRFCGLEAQMAAIADDLAYLHHDLDDGLSTGALRLDQVMTLEPFRRVWDEVDATFPQQTEYRKIKETIRRLMSRQVRDVLNTTQANIQKSGVKTVEDVRALDHPLVTQSPDAAAESKVVRAFLMEAVYRYFKVNRMSFKAQRVIEGLFDVFMDHRRTLPEHIQALLPADKGDMSGRAAVVCDYIASMTDRAAMREFDKLYGGATQL
jgi:dGTPase